VTKPVRPLTQLADVVLTQLRLESLQTQQQDDDCLPAPDPMSSAQSRRLPVEVH